MKMERNMQTIYYVFLTKYMRYIRIYSVYL